MNQCFTPFGVELKGAEHHGEAVGVVVGGHDVWSLKPHNVLK
jgi:hypothetical protein